MTLLVLSSLLFGLAACGGGGGGGGGSASTEPLAVRVEEVAAALSFPSDIAFAPDGRLFFSELSTGNVRVIKDGQLLAQPFATVPVPPGGGEGLVGIAFDPDFGANARVYVFHAHPAQGKSRVARFVASGDTGTFERVVLDGLPRGGHMGGRLLFDRNGLLYVSTGDSDNPQLAQELASLAGKVLRVTTEGAAPGDNPFPASPVYALGFRNVFGLALHPAGTLYLADNGPSCDDEVNRVTAGGNYGWRPGQPCGDTDPNFIQPIVRITPSIGVTAVAFYSGELFPQLQGQLLLGDFNSGAIRRYVVDEGQNGLVTGEAFLLPGGFGPVLDIEVGPDGAVYFSGPQAIYRIVPE